MKTTLEETALEETALQFPMLRQSTPASETFIGSYVAKLEELLKASNLPPGMVIALMSNLNFHEQLIPAHILSSINYCHGFETPDDQPILAEALKRVNGTGKINVDFPIRIPIGRNVLQYNFIRGFRPRRAARKSDTPLDLPFDPSKFNYSSKLCDPEEFNFMHQDNLDISFILNRYPFAPYHFLLIPNRKTGNHSQYLDGENDRDLIEAFWNFVSNSNLGNSIRLGYNSNSAHASVNHLHAQGFFTTEDWEPPLDRIARQSKKQSKKASPEFFLPGTHYLPSSDCPNGLLGFIKEMNTRWKLGEKLAYCFYLTPKGAYLFPRKYQGDEAYHSCLEQCNFTTGFAFFEMLGEIVCPAKDVSIFDLEDIEEKTKRLYGLLSLN
ncbi:hypothetical protein J4443_00295 [Candidatus Woesearchaeota archaeon]|nr:hypothetical protein [Candidatus Woesearchaeota archaeon]